MESMNINRRTFVKAAAAVGALIGSALGTELAAVISEKTLELSLIHISEPTRP